MARMGSYGFGKIGTLAIMDPDGFGKIGILRSGSVPSRLVPGQAHLRRLALDVSGLNKLFASPKHIFNQSKPRYHLPSCPIRVGPTVVPKKGDT